MKKKALLTIFALVVASITLVGCISASPHKMLSDPWLEYEEAHYDVTRTLKDGDSDAENNPKIKGTSVIITERVNNKDLTLGVDSAGEPYNDYVGKLEQKSFTGTYVTIDTVLEDGSEMHAQIAFTVQLQPIASYKYISVKGYENNQPAKDLKQAFSLQYRDGDKAATYRYSDNSAEVQESTGNVELDKVWKKKPYFDNLMIYHIIRSSYNNSRFNPVPIQVASIETKKLKVLTSSPTAPIAYKLGTEEQKKNPNIKGVKCDLISIAVKPEAPINSSGMPIQAYISTETNGEYKANNINLTHARKLIAFAEGDMYYELTRLIEGASKDMAK